MNSSPSIRARPFYFNKVYVNPKDENEVYVTELSFHQSTDGGRTFDDRATPHGDDHVMWINPDNPEDLHRDQRRRRQRHAGRRPELVDADESADRRVLHGRRRRAVSVPASTAPQQDNSTVVVANVPPFSWPIDQPTQTWFQASGCESGQIRTAPDGKIIYGDCKGEFGRYNVETGQEQHYWIYPQQRYGKMPKDMRYRFVRQAPIEIDRTTRTIVYHGSQYVHKTD